VAPIVLPYHPTAARVARPTFELFPAARLFEEFTDNFNETPTNRQSNFRTGLSPGAASR
jgi:hypothetical protein